MSISALYIMDLKGKIILCRNYRGDIPMNISEKFARILNNTEESQLTPVIMADAASSVSLFRQSQSQPQRQQQQQPQQQQQQMQPAQLRQPISNTSGISFIWIRHQDLIFMCTTRFNLNAVSVLSFLHTICAVFRDYFGEVNEESIRDNFVVVYELLDEMMDFGYPQSTESKILKEFILIKERHPFVSALTGGGLGLGSSSSATRNGVPSNLTLAVGWRPEGIRHKKDEFFLDVVEKLNLLVSSTGQVLRSEVLGSLQCRSQLSGMPRLKLGLNAVVLGGGGRGGGAAGAGSGAARSPARGSVEMEDIRFHQCVELAKFEANRIISFIPPDGDFELMSYRLTTKVRPLISIEAVIKPFSRSRIEYAIKARSNYSPNTVAKNVEIIIAVPSDADSPKFKCGAGKVKYTPDSNSMSWNISKLPGQVDYVMRASFGLPSIASNSEAEEKAQQTPIRIKFEMPTYTVSGIQVRYIKIVEKPGYKAFTWVRYVTENGDYEIRTSVAGGSGKRVTSASPRR